MDSSPGPRAVTSLSSEQLVDRRRRLLGSGYRLFYDEPLHVVRGEGVWLYDPDGNAYLDAYNNVPCVGHCHPAVVAAGAGQAAILNTHTRYLHRAILDYAERLLNTFPSELANVMFTCSGSEANDLAYRLARSATGGTGFIVTDFAYHGGTAAIAELSPSLGVGLAPTTRTVPPPDAYRASSESVGEAFGHAVRAAISDLAADSMRPAALLVDPIFSSDGIFPDPAGFLGPAVAAIHEAGGVFIADEVQVGFGRTGDGMWGYDRHRVFPDIVTLGKPMGNGHPMSGVVARPDIMESLGRRSRYFNTFAGNPVSCSIGMAVLDVIEDEKLITNARDVGNVLVDGLRRLADRYDLIGDVRGVGLFIGVELVRDRAMQEPDPASTARLVNGLRRRRVLVSSTGPHGNVLKIRPPLVFTRDHADVFLTTIDDALTEVADEA
jgi:4-aminobutyrate aminotransferase-like enzyme